jgi:hypothetical protein
MLELPPEIWNQIFNCFTILERIDLMDVCTYWCEIIGENMRSLHIDELRSKSHDVDAFKASLRRILRRLPKLVELDTYLDNDEDITSSLVVCPNVSELLTMSFPPSIWPNVVKLSVGKMPLSDFQLIYEWPSLRELTVCIWPYPGSVGVRYLLPHDTRQLNDKLTHLYVRFDCGDYDASLDSLINDFVAIFPFRKLQALQIFCKRSSSMRVHTNELVDVESILGSNPDLTVLDISFPCRPFTVPWPRLSLISVYIGDNDVARVENVFEYCPNASDLAFLDGYELYGAMYEKDVIFSPPAFQPTASPVFIGRKAEVLTFKTSHGPLQLVTLNPMVPAVIETWPHLCALNLWNVAMNRDVEQLLHPFLTNRVVRLLIYDCFSPEDSKFRVPNTMTKLEVLSIRSTTIDTSNLSHVPEIRFMEIDNYVDLPAEMVRSAMKLSTVRILGGNLDALKQMHLTRSLVELMYTLKDEDDLGEFSVAIAKLMRPNKNLKSLSINYGDTYEKLELLEAFLVELAFLCPKVEIT